MERSAMRDRRPGFRSASSGLQASRISASILRLPDEQLAPLAAAYQAARAAKRRHATLIVVVLILAIVLAGKVGEVDVAKFIANIHRFPNYLRDLTPALS